MYEIVVRLGDNWLVRADGFEKKSHAQSYAKIIIRCGEWGVRKSRMSNYTKK